MSPLIPIKTCLVIVPIQLFFSCKSEMEQFDANSNQKEVLTHKGIDSVLALFKQVNYTELNQDYILYSKSDEKFKTSLKGEKYYVLKGDDVLRFIVGTYRIKDFLSTDLYFTKNRADYSKGVMQYWLVDKSLLYMLLDLVLALEQGGLDKYAFKVRESHRHPKFNTLRGGTSKSQHLWGRAIDIVVEDINRDGKINNEDKRIVLEIMEETVGDKGGLGRYPKTMTVHFDVRGYRARWDAH